MKITSDLSQKIIREYINDQQSMAQIAHRYRISPTTVYQHLKKNDVQRRSIGDAITALNITQFGKKPFQIKSSLNNEESELRIAGVMLYWGEGTKGASTVKFTNSDPAMIRVFMSFLRNICGIDEGRLRALVHCYPDQQPSYLVEFWSSVSNIPIKQFYRCTIHEGRPGTYKKKSQYGTVVINYSDKRLLTLILSWIQLYKENVPG